MVVQGVGGLQQLGACANVLAVEREQVQWSPLACITASSAVSTKASHIRGSELGSMVSFENAFALPLSSVKMRSSAA